MRSRDAYNAVLDSLHVDTAEEYRPGHLGDGLTWCNLFLHNATKALDCAVPFIKANLQVQWLGGLEGSAAGWREIVQPPPSIEFSRAVCAAQRANAGFPTCVVWQNPDLEGHGHVAMVVPESAGLKVLVTIAQAGAHNFRHGSLGNGFGNLPVRFFTHD